MQRAAVLVEPLDPSTAHGAWNSTNLSPLAGCDVLSLWARSLGALRGRGLYARSTTHENYAPCALEQLVGQGYDYWALGHIDERVVLHTDPNVVFAGNVQGRHTRETTITSAAQLSAPAGAAGVSVRRR